MSEPKPMKQVHEIRHKLHEKTKNMSDDEFLEFYHSQSETFKKEVKDIKPAKDLKTFFANLDKKQTG